MIHILHLKYFTKLIHVYVINIIKVYNELNIIKCVTIKKTKQTFNKLTYVISLG